MTIINQVISINWSYFVFFANSTLILLAVTSYSLYIFPNLAVLQIYGKGNELKDDRNKKSLNIRSSIAIVNFVASLQVPKSWFLHFYIFASILAWIQLVSHRNAAVILLAIQCTRRLYDQLVAPVTSAKMNVLHYLIGYIFYVDEIISTTNANVTTNTNVIVLALFIFAIGWILQFRVHMHLFSLKKYTMPYMAIFSYCACPHYLAESIMYLAILMLDVSNSVAWASLFWIFIGLGVASQQSKHFYETKFPNNPNVPKYGMIPYIW